MTTPGMADKRPGLLHGTGSNSTIVNREEHLQPLYSRWDQFADEYEQARKHNDQEVMTNLRGLMLLIKKEIRRLGGELREFPYPEEPHLADF